ncbi:hypothetical protein, partial [Pseudomonas sp. 2995-1]|uniref:hypothetical protein n=1 Tax=Pseudomonas sp. 2995-1 TaxID=1712679 RepID=UPI000C369B66
LKGDYHIAGFDVEGNGLVLIPYEATVDTGDITLYVVKDSNVLWEKTITQESEGFMEFEGEVGTYDIGIVTEEADDIFIEIS